MKCSYCKIEIPEGTGTMYVKKDGTVSYLCSGKCEKNMLNLKRKPVNLKWITKKQISGKKK